MKALILSAGFGTRLKPYTDVIPKPLFTINSDPIIDHIIESLLKIGCEYIIINTHHLHSQIEFFINSQNYPVNIELVHEPDILETGGAIANTKHYFDDSPFFVINADIISNINLKKVYEHHLKSKPLATLVLHDYPQFNMVGVNDKNYIQNFNSSVNALAFTGVQVLSPQIFKIFPDKDIFSSIEVYTLLCKEQQINAYIEKDIFWSDIGTIESYSRTSCLVLAASYFNIGFDKIKDIRIDPLAGDGSDRYWYRAIFQAQTIIISDHGICLPKTERLDQLNAFLKIGNHLKAKKLPIPEIFNFDSLSGIVLVEDLGNHHLEAYVHDHYQKGSSDNSLIIDMYKKVIDQLILFSNIGLDGFKNEWAWQTVEYSKELILEKECRYFFEEFLQGYLNLNLHIDYFVQDFEIIAKKAMQFQYIGLMHRDMQSRNIMIHNESPYFIDFQTARKGPLQYDMASLLIDPYVCLEEDIQDKLMAYTIQKLKFDTTERINFMECFKYCCVTRNLQILGAFSFLSQKKNKKGFEQYIPDAVKSLKLNINNLKNPELDKFSELVNRL